MNSNLAFSIIVKATYCVVNQKSVDDAFWFFAGVHAKAPVSKAVAITGTAQLFHDNGAYGFASANGYSLEIDPSVQLTEHLALNASARLVGPFETPADGRKARLIGTLGLAATF